MKITIALCAIMLAIVAGLMPAGGSAAEGEDEKIVCANLIYAGSKSSVCFSDKFLETVARETHVKPERRFKAEKLAADDLFDYPFWVLTGAGACALMEEEGNNLAAYLERGGFLLASAGCSSRDWDKSFRQEVKNVFPEYKLEKIPLDHPIFSTVYDIREVKLKHGGAAQLEGLVIDGRIVMIYSSEGLNDTGNVNGCCCCGGNEVQNCHEINVNIFMYALTH